MKFSLKDTILFAIRFPLDHSQALLYPAMYSAIVLAGVLLLAASGVSLFEGVPFKDFGVQGPALSTLFATSMPLAMLLLIPMEVAIILYCFKGKTFKQDFLSMDMAMKSVWYLVASLITLVLTAGPMLIYNYFQILYPQADFLVFMVVGFPAYAVAIFFTLTLIFLPLRTALGHRIDIIENIQLTKDYFFPIFLVTVALIVLVFLRILATVVLNLFFSLLPAFLIVVTTAIITAAVDILFVLIATAAVCNLYAYVAKEKMKIGSVVMVEKGKE